MNNLGILFLGILIGMLMMCGIVLLFEFYGKDMNPPRTIYAALSAVL